MVYTESLGDPAQASQFLARLDDQWALHVARIGPCRHKPTPSREPYEALVHAVAYQQLHAKAGDAILRRFVRLSSSGAFPTPKEVQRQDPAAQLALGFSRAKLATIRRVADATIENIVPNRAVALAMADDELIDRLSSLRGIGRWTVEMFLIYSLARPDFLPCDDFGIREGYRRIQGLDKTPTPREMRGVGLAFAPYRTTASWYLWRAAAPASPSRTPANLS
jgi:DNA-3-methyladenine glycosylase II